MISEISFLRLCAVWSKVTKLAAVVAGSESAQKVFHIHRHDLSGFSQWEGERMSDYRLIIYFDHRLTS